MPVHMKFERNALAQYLVNNLKSLTAADPNIVADYVVALLKNDVPEGELQKLCADRLEVFLGHSSMPFTAKLFEALQDGSLQSANSNLDVMKSPEPSVSNTAVETLNVNSLLSKEDTQSSSSEHLNDPGDKENSDDDDDRNHKHRRRDAPENSFDNDVQGQSIRRPDRKRSKNYDSGQLYMETRFQSREIQEYSPSIDREVPSRLEKRQFGISPSVRSSSDLSSRSRLNTSIRTDPGPRFDLFGSVGRAPLGRGRGRSLLGRGQLDSRFNSMDSLDFTSHMASQRPVHPSLFVGSGLQGTGSSQNASWGSFSFIHGMSNGIMDPLHPLGLQPNLRPTLNPMNIGMPRQRCRDFEERGFCLRGDMCPMEHGLNRIVVEDVQSLSQFNLPVSIPNLHAVGVQAGAVPLHRGPVSSALMATKNMFSKNSKPTANEDGLRLNGSTSTVGGEQDVYDPDQPLWNSTDTSAALLRLPSPSNEDDSLWDGDISRKTSRLPDGNEGDLRSRNLTANIGSQGAGSSVWGRIGSESKSEIEVKFENNKYASGDLAKEMGDVRGATVASSFPSDHEKLVISDEFGSKVATTQTVLMSRPDFERKSGRTQQKATRTLYVNGIPKKNNRREALFPHFQKFGEVIDIYIPSDSERAFVQFSKREEAEAALKSPDAVMGNRFIKLFWANRDRILDEGQSGGEPKALQYPRVAANSVQFRPPVEIENLSVAAKRKISTKAVELSVASVGSQKSVLMNGPKAMTSPTKKLESLELLEELRRKQELLAHKRDEFRRQLVKFEKQASIKKIDGPSEQAVKRHKTDIESGSAKAADSKSTTISILKEFQDAGKSLERSTSAEIIVSPSSKAYPGTIHQSSQIVKQATRIQSPYPNRFKLDNRPTSFRILPPLPAKLANAAVLKDHFSKFTDLASIVFEDLDETENSNLKEPEKKAVCVTFHTRQSAERAYQAGKSWEGCSLKFVWANSSSVALKDRRGNELPLNLIVCPAEDNEKTRSVGSSSPCVVKPTCRPLSDIDTKKYEDYGTDVEGMNCKSVALISSIEAKESTPTIVIHENQPK
ncbi:Zinc finger CCCH domain-containing protein 27 [Platanthera guangdongensis]|uniref:Zinc finger CCCH domain-containing protein 27 n=1 Tax=Platanthera guangdongensis TaxID=2320717 RepID=A0ABR2MLY0_9ASPA